VIFLDQADLLASLASDWCRGAAAAHWWWRTLLHTPLIARDLLVVWREAAAYIPAALEKLGQEKIEFVRRLSDPEVNELLTTVMDRFAVHGLSLGLELNSVVSTESRGVRSKANRVELHQLSTEPSAPWHKVVAESSSQGLSVAQQRFLGLSLMLLRAPALVRTKSFTRAVEEWQQGFPTTDLAKDLNVERTEPALRPSVIVTTSLSEAPQIKQTSPAGLPEIAVHDDVISTRTHIDYHDRRTLDQEPRTATSARRQSYFVDGTVTELDDTSTGESGLAKVAERLAPMDQTNDSRTILYHTPSESIEAPVQIDAVIDEPKVSVHEQISSEVGAEHEQAEFASDVALVSDAYPIEVIAEVESQFAGVFYLINLGIYLGLYGDFTMPAKPGIELNIWDFVALLGRELVGEVIEHDPVWLVLAKLSGREVDTSESLPDQLSLPELPTEPLDQILLSNIKLQDLKKWLAQLVPLVRRRLRLAFGLNQTGNPGPLLVAHAGFVRVTPTHIDVTFALAELPLMIRIAGLDRDPGWVPAAGRLVAFHFV
jgi:hypothetical protein